VTALTELVATRDSPSPVSSHARQQPEGRALHDNQDRDDHQRQPEGGQLAVGPRA
jgi:hypothetical protein